MYAGGTTSGIRINGKDYENTVYQLRQKLEALKLILTLLGEMLTHLIFNHFQQLVEVIQEMLFSIQMQYH